MKRLIRVLHVSLLAAFGLAAGSALAQSYPNKAVRFILPMVPGGQMDSISRLLGQKLSEAWKQPVVVENRGGSGGIVGANVVAKAEPDGYTFLFAASGIAISPSLYRKLPFDPLKDLVPVSQIYTSFLILVVNSSVPATSVRGLIEHAKTQPGRLNYASTGTGGSPHLAAELFKSMTRTDIAHIPYKGTAQMNAAVVANEVQVAFTTQEGVLPFVKSGRLRGLAITSRARSRVVPDVPTLEEAGVRDYELPNWLGLFAPAGTPREIITRLHSALVTILAMPGVRDRIIGMGNEPLGSTPEEFAAAYQADVARFARIAKEAHIPLQD